jgi:type IV pilus assembly protein PilV
MYLEGGIVIMKQSGISPLRKQIGTSLIEVLVAVTILAIGLLGIAGIQLMTKQSGFDSAQRTTATMLANFIIERVRANPGVLVNYAGDAATPATPVGGTTMGATEPVPNCSAATPCTTLELATHDLWEWEQLIDGASEKSGTTNTGGLLQPTACITTTVPAALTDRSGQYIITIVWRGKTALSNPSATNTCGSASGKYDNNANDNAYRRMLVIETFVTTTL